MVRPKDIDTDKEITRIQFLGYTLMAAAPIWLVCYIIYRIFTKGCGC
jgi:hypothetical protein